MSLQVVLARRPSGALQESDLRIEEVTVGAPQAGELLLRTRYVSMDPFTRLFLDETTLGGSMPGLPLGAPLPGAAVAEVLTSTVSGFATGDLVEGRFGWREMLTADAKSVKKWNASLAPPETALGMLGLPGLTAYTGVVTIGAVAAGETVIVSSAAGSVGLLAGQIAKWKGARAIGIAGGPKKCQLALEHGFDACIDYRANNFGQLLIDACPGGAHFYLDNVGGEISLAAYSALRRGARVALCGLLSLYESDGASAPGALARFMRLIMSRGLTIRAYATIESAAPDAAAALADLRARNMLRLPETVIDGLAGAPAALCALLQGTMMGKIIVRVA